MVDIKLAKQEYIKYVNTFKIQNNEYLKNKIEHSMRVMELSTKIAKGLNLNQEEIEIATLIGLLHDIGRYEEVTIYKANGKKADHGDIGAEVLQKNNLIRNFIKENIYDNIIFTAIKNHNKFKPETSLTNKQQLFTNIIRDADKLDIFYECEEFYWANGKEELEKEIITEQDIMPILQHKNIEKKKNLKSPQITRTLTTMSFVFDINYKTSIKILKEADYINKYLNKFQFKDTNTQELIKKVQEEINKYINTRMIE